jgi:hypothetical protein
MTPISANTRMIRRIIPKPISLSSIDTFRTIGKFYSTGFTLNVEKTDFCALPHTCGYVSGSNAARRSNTDFKFEVSFFDRCIVDAVDVNLLEKQEIFVCLVCACVQCRRNLIASLGVGVERDAFQKY